MPRIDLTTGMTSTIFHFKLFTIFSHVEDQVVAFQEYPFAASHHGWPLVFDFYTRAHAPLHFPYIRMGQQGHKKYLGYLVQNPICIGCFLLNDSNLHDSALPLHLAILDIALWRMAIHVNLSIVSRGAYPAQRDHSMFPHTLSFSLYSWSGQVEDLLSSSSWMEFTFLHL